MELALKVKFYLDFHRVARPWRQTLTNGSDVKYVFPRCYNRFVGQHRFSVSLFIPIGWSKFGPSFQQCESQAYLVMTSSCPSRGVPTVSCFSWTRMSVTAWVVGELGELKREQLYEIKSQEKYKLTLPLPPAYRLQTVSVFPLPQPAIERLKWAWGAAARGLRRKEEKIIVLF